MLYDYIITLRKQPPGTVDLVSQIMYAIPVIVFLFFAFATGTTIVIYLFIAIAIVVCWAFLYFKRKRTGFVYYTPGLAFAAIGWFSGPYANIWLGVLYIAAALVEREFKFPKEIGFSKEEVVFNSLLKRRYSWDQVKNAMIREGIITVDFKNNKIFQRELAEGVSAQTEQEFNAFCNEQLQPSRHENLS